MRQSLTSNVRQQPAKRRLHIFSSSQTWRARRDPSAENIGSDHVMKGRRVSSNPPPLRLNWDMLENKTVDTCHSFTLSQHEHPASRSTLTSPTCMYSARMCPWYPHSVCSSCTPSSFSTHRKSCTCVRHIRTKQSTRHRYHLFGKQCEGGARDTSATMSPRFLQFHATRNECILEHACKFWYCSDEWISNKINVAKQSRVGSSRVAKTDLHTVCIPCC